tara:strand:- start:2022 stop:2162 length:141 start_codon:yes stop_codon:yes gene_type:complete
MTNINAKNGIKAPQLTDALFQPMNGRFDLRKEKKDKKNKKGQKKTA